MTRSAEITLMEDVAGFGHDPLGFVHYVFPWGEGALEGHAGPDSWQEDVLNELGRGSAGTAALRLAVASGHGIGKTALIAWITLWFISTRAHPQIVVTANTKPQLETKTWRELAKWHKLALNHDWFEWTSTKFYLQEHPETWFAAAIPWSKERPEAFQGAHERHVLMIYDEGSAIDQAIWEATEGAMTTPGAVWVVFGNPTRNTGAFRQCFGRQRHRWITRQIDSRTAKMADKAQIQRWIEDYGEDSDFVRVRVKGEFPRAASNQSIPSDLVEAAAGKSLSPEVYSRAPRTLGVDVARFGDDQTVIVRR
ncbi:MAG: terminase, partial [Pseudomonadota bacterium]